MSSRNSRECCLGLGGERCEACNPGCAHICTFEDNNGMKCGAINSHRSRDCPLRISCRLNCGFCSSGSNHICIKCGAIDSHRSSDCPSNSKKATAPKKASVVATSAPKKASVATTSAPKKALVAPTFVSLRKLSGTRNGSNVCDGNSIVISYTVKNGVIYIHVHLDAVGRYNPKVKGLVIGAGGANDCGNALKAAEKENMEEHGVKKGLDYKYIESNGSFHTFLVKCNDRDFSGRVTTPQEVGDDPNYLQFRFPNGYQTQVPTTWAVPLDDLLNLPTSVVYKPFQDTLRRVKNTGLFI